MMSNRAGPPERSGWHETSPDAAARLAPAQRLVLAGFVAGTVLLIVAATDAISRQPALLASIASGTLHVYLDAIHRRRSVRAVLIGHLTAGSAAWLMHLAVGTGYAAAGGTLLVTVAAMVLLDAIHPPAASTALSFAFRSGHTPNHALFLSVLVIAASLAMLDWGLAAVSRWLLRRAPS